MNMGWGQEWNEGSEMEGGRYGGGMEGGNGDGMG